MKDFGEHGTRLSRDLLLYGSGRVAMALLGMATVPILTRSFGPSGFGAIEGIVTISSMFGLVATLMLESSAQRSYFDYTERQGKERSRVLSTALWSLILWTTAFLLLAGAVSEGIAEVALSKSAYGSLLMLSFAGVSINGLVNFLREIFRLESKPIHYSFYTLLNSVVALVAIVAMVSVQGIGVSGYFLGTLMAGIVVLPFLFISVRRNIVREFDKRELKKMLEYGLPLIPASAGIWILAMADRIFLLRWTSLEDLGFYAIAAKLSQIILLFVTAFGLAWSPFILSIYSRDKEEEKRVRGRITTFYIFGLGLLTVFVTAFSKFLILIFSTADFLEASKVIGILALGTAAAGATQVLCTGINIARKTRYLALYTGIAAGANIVLNSLLVPRFGSVGAASTTALCYLILCILYYHQSQKLYASPYELNKILKIAVATGAFVAVASLVQQEELLSEFLVKALLFVCFPVVCIAWNVFDLEELRAFRKVLRGV